MRDYARLMPKFWVTGSGKALRRHEDARTLVLYLITGPHSNMLGLYYLPIPTMAHELGWDETRVRAALGTVAEKGFALYDEAAELVLMVEGAAHQVGESLKVTDNQLKAIRRELAMFGDHPFVAMFAARYHAAYHLPKPPSPPPVIPPKMGENQSDPPNEETPTCEPKNEPPPDPLPRGTQGVAKGSRTPPQGIPSGSGSIQSNAEQEIARAREGSDDDLRFLDRLPTSDAEYNTRNPIHELEAELRAEPKFASLDCRDAAEGITRAVLTQEGIGRYTRRQFRDTIALAALACESGCTEARKRQQLGYKFRDLKDGKLDASRGAPGARGRDGPRRPVQPSAPDAKARLDQLRAELHNPTEPNPDAP